MDKIAYNKPNWYDNLTGKEKNISRRDFSEMDDNAVADNTYDYMVTRAMRNLRDFIERYYNDEPEVIDDIQLDKNKVLYIIFSRRVVFRILLCILKIL